MRYRRKRYSAKENFSSCGRSKLGLSLKKQSVFRRSRLCRSRGNVVRVYIVRDAVGVSYTIIIKGLLPNTNLGFFCRFFSRFVVEIIFGVIGRKVFRRLCVVVVVVVDVAVVEDERRVVCSRKNVIVDESRLWLWMRLRKWLTVRSYFRKVRISVLETETRRVVSGSPEVVVDRGPRRNRGSTLLLVRRLPRSQER